MPTPNYDSWKLATPWDDYKEVTVSECVHCGNDLYAGDEVYSDGDHDFCDKDCAEKYVIVYLDEYMDVFKDTFPIKRVERFKKWIKRNWEKEQAWDCLEDIFYLNVLDYPDYVWEG